MPEFRELLKGYHRFRSENYEVQHRRWERLAEGQSPPLMIIGCCDSRVDPAMIFDTDPGQAFVVRNVANLVPPCEEGGGRHGVSAAVEFAVTALQVRHIVVLGHGACGGVAAALAGGDLGAPGPSFIDHWVSILDEARDRVLANLRTFSWVQEREAAGTLKLHGVYFAISEGVLYLLDEQSGSFRPA
jgi:carbonic anhydrase